MLDFYGFAECWGAFFLSCWIMYRKTVAEASRTGIWGTYALKFFRSLLLSWRHINSKEIKLLRITEDLAVENPNIKRFLCILEKDDLLNPNLFSKAHMSLEATLLRAVLRQGESYRTIESIFQNTEAKSFYID